MNPNPDPTLRHVLALNRGSSSIKFAVFRIDAVPERVWRGTVERIGLGGTALRWSAAAGVMSEPVAFPVTTRDSAADSLIDWLEQRDEFASIVGVGHRVVHGMRHTEPEPITPELLDELHGIIPCDPEHLPGELELIEAFWRRHPQLPQLACFDTAFHRTMPRVATLLPIPRRFDAKGIQRYGFHGLSYAYLMEELSRLGDPTASRGHVVLAHLGNGASMAAVRDGKSVDTSMGFTPTAGLPMGTRSGDLDPGLVGYLARSERMTVGEFHRMVNQESGLLGVSETSSDMRDLLALEATDPRAAEAVRLFCYQSKKCLGAFAAALGGLDTIVFSGGIGENCPSVRSRICDGLRFFGIELDPIQNSDDAGVISAATSRVVVRVIRTDEESMIARSVCRFSGWGFTPIPASAVGFYPMATARVSGSAFRGAIPTSLPTREIGVG